MSVNTNGAAADNSAMLDVVSTSKGMLVLRMTHSQVTAISSPATGLLVYQTDATAGFYYYNGSAWVAVVGSAAGVPQAATSRVLTLIPVWPPAQ